MLRSTVLVTLLSPENNVTLALNAVIQSIQDGLDSCPREIAPQVFCLYHRQGDVFQYQLTQGSPALPPRNQIPTLLLTEQLQNFFSHTPVQDAVSSGGPVYLFVGAHGEPTGPQVGGIVNQLLQRMRRLFSFLGSRVADNAPRIESWQNIFKKPAANEPAIAADIAADPEMISLTALNDMLKCAFPTRLKTLVLHTCLLSSLETIYEINHVEQQVACESMLKNHMTLAPWIPLAATGARLKCLSGVFPPAKGMFSTHVINSSDTLVLIQCLNQVGIELQSKLSAFFEQIDNARVFSRVDATDMVDLWNLSLLLSSVCSATVLAHLRHAIEIVQLDFKTTRTDPFHGISVFFPDKDASTRISNLPLSFQNAASHWVSFLNLWTSN